jgi:hypothetical protein
MNELDDLGRDLVELARDGDDPTPEDCQRVRRRLIAAGALGAAAASSTQAAASAGLGNAAALGSAAGGGALSATKVAAVLAASLSVGAIVAASLVTVFDRSTGDPAPAARTQPPEAPPLTPLAPTATPAPETSTPDEVAHPALTPPSSDREPGPATVAATPAPHPPAAAAKTEEPADVKSITRETRLIEEARAALAAGDGATALRLAQAHSARFPGGALAEEAAAVGVLAHCKLGHSDAAQREAARFRARYPSSPHLPRLAGSCATNDATQ